MKLFLLLYLVAELSWRFINKYRYVLLEPPVEGPPGFLSDPRHHSLEVFRRFEIHLAPHMDAADFFSRWFYDVPFSEILRENVKDLVSYGFFYCTRHDFAIRFHDLSLDSFVDRLEKSFGVTFPPGRNDKLKFRAHLWEPLKTHHVPLVIYVISEVSSLVAHFIFVLWGFRVHRCTLGRSTRGANTHPYAFVLRGSEEVISVKTKQRVVRRTSTQAKRAFLTTDISAPPTVPPLDQDPASPPSDTGTHATSSLPHHMHPIVFLHGIGIGLMPYLAFIRRWMRANRGRAIICLPMDHVALKLSAARPATADDFAENVAQLLRQLGYSRSSIIGHSYGCFVASRLAQSYPELVETLTLIDPVSMMLVHPTLTQNFVYRSLQASTTDLSRYLISRELLIASTMCRRFYWSTLMFWPEDGCDAPPKGCVISLGDNDLLLPVDLIRAQCLRSENCVLLNHPAQGHGEFLGEPHWQLKIIEATVDIEKRGARDCVLGSRRVSRAASMQANLAEMQLDSPRDVKKRA